jgi:hypothetical protein
VMCPPGMRERGFAYGLSAGRSSGELHELITKMKSPLVEQRAFHSTLRRDDSRKSAQSVAEAFATVKVTGLP